MRHQSQQYSFFLSMLCIICLLCACSSQAAPQQGNASPTATSPATNSGASSNPTPPPASAQLPPTLTSCPQAGTARAAVMSSFTPGTHQAVIYLHNQGANIPAIEGVLNRYDVTTGSTTTLVKAKNTSLFDAQISADGQWVLFAENTTQGAKIELVRVDGHMLQTLYCTSSSQNIFNILWSPDQKAVLITQAQANAPLTLTGVYLLNLTSGKVQMELDGQTSKYATPVLWLDNTHVYFQDFTVSPQPTTLYLLDTGKNAPQKWSDLEPIDKINAFSSFDKSLDGTQLLLSECTPTQQGYPGSPSTIMMNATTGGSSHTIYTSRTFAITDIRMISSTTLLIIVANGSGSTKDNGLWKVQLDGTGLIRLTTDSQSIFNDGFATSRSPWANVSRDGAFYSLLNQNANGNNTYTNLVFAPLNGSQGAPKIIATVNVQKGSLDVAGWTTI